MKAADLRYYIDADILGLAHLLSQVRSDLTYPGDPGGTVHKRTRPACPITTPKTPDTEWLPRVAEQGWLIITRDHAISENPAELRAVRESGARMVALAGDDAGNIWGQLEVVMKRWRKIELLLNEDGPFIVLASRTVWRRLELDPDSGARKKREPRTAPAPRRPRAGSPDLELWPQGQPGPRWDDDPAQ